MKPLDLKTGFPPVPVEAWEAAVRSDLKGADFDKRLVWRTEEGVAVRPYYTRADVEHLPWIDTAPGEYPYVRGSGKPWQMLEPGTEPVAHVAADAWHNQGASAVQEIGCALAAGAELLATGSPAAKLVFRFGIGSTFFIEIAKLRAARLCWAQVSSEFGIPDAEACMAIHAVTATANKTLYDPYNNLLRSSAEALAAVLGGCDWLSVIPSGYDPRLAANIGLILKEESHLDLVADPGGGAYYVEVLTDLLAREAWKQLQEVEKAGGFSAFRASGALDRAIAVTRGEREKALATRRRVIIGVSAYANAAEQLPEVSLPELETWRMAGMFERLRLRTERHVKRTGVRPKVLLLEAGDAKMRQARSAFCAGLFACAGFAAEVSDTLHDAPLLVLCSSDPEYRELATRIVPQTTRPVLVAGNPKDETAALKAAGVAGFVYLGSNAVETLEHWQNQLGLGD